ncbi:MAG: YihY family inner membrane protein [Oscillospiraceae bacterium]|nr:YihY family inner membrane protein [Oscillospiraceae bacterium]
MIGELCVPQKLPEIFRDVIEIYTRSRVTRSAAALSYYLTLSVFPFLICLNAMIASLHVTADEIFSLGSGAVPGETMRYISNYITYISDENSGALLLAGLTVMFTSSSAAFRTLMGIMADLQGQARFKGVGSFAVSFFMSFLFLAAIYLSCALIVSGEWLIRLIKNSLGVDIFTENWQWLRFLLMFLLLYMIIYAIYEITSPREKRCIPRTSGAILAALLLVAVSIVFSYMIDMSTRYTLVYGSLASIIVLMVWFYICSVILIMGNAFNLIIYKYERRQQ